MNVEHWLTLALVIIGLGGGIWGIIKALLRMDRNSVGEQQKAMWKRLDEIRKELSEAQRELDVLKERIHGLPDREFLQAKLDSMEEKLEEKLERKFDTLAKRIQEVFEQASTRFRCPHIGG